MSCIRSVFKRRFCLLFTFAVLSFFPIAVCYADADIPASTVSKPSVLYDVVVVGGSPSGVAAALAAARRGCKVLLLEERPHLGGEIVYSMLNMFDVPARPGETAKVHGIFAEFFDQLGMAFDTGRVRRLFENAVAIEPNLQCLTSTKVTGFLRGAAGWEFSLNRSSKGKASITRHVVAPIVIDATPDASIAVQTGAEFYLGREGSRLDKGMQAAGLLFSVSGVDWMQLRQYVRGRRRPVGKEELRRFPASGGQKNKTWLHLGGTRGNYAYERGDIVRSYRPLGKHLMFLSINFGRQSDGSVILNTLNIVGVNGLSSYSQSLARREAVAEIPRFLAHLRKNLPGFGRARLRAVAPELYIRETRHLIGWRTLQVADVKSGHVFPDRIAGVSYPIDLHPYQLGATNPFGAQRYRYSLPLGALVPRAVDGVFVASRSLSASYQAAGSARVIPVTMAAGEAAGVAAWLCIRKGVTPHQLVEDEQKVKLLQQNLRDWGVDIGDKATS